LTVKRDVIAKSVDLPRVCIARGVDIVESVVANLVPLELVLRHVKAWHATSTYIMGVCGPRAVAML
jgi:hypothetical protein